jgi:hypothetical protein
MGSIFNVLRFRRLKGVKKSDTSNFDAAAGTVEESARIVRQIRRRWPRVRILLRGDSGFCRNTLMNWREANRVDYIFGLARNERLVAEIGIDLAAAEVESTTTGRPARRFRDCTRQTLDSWDRPRRLIGKGEWANKRRNRGRIKIGIHGRILRNPQSALYLHSIAPKPVEISKNDECGRTSA